MVITPNCAFQRTHKDGVAAEGDVGLACLHTGVGDLAEAKVQLITGNDVMRLTKIAMALAFGVCTMASAFAQIYPAKPVRVIVPLPERGGADVIGRSVSQKLSELWRQQVTVENRPGASGTVGVSVAAKSPPDGYTLLVNSSLQVTYATLFTNLAYDPVKDFVPVALLHNTPYVLVVGKATGVNTVAELIAEAKVKPGQFKFSGGFAGTRSHLGAEKFNLEAGIQAVLVSAPNAPTGLREIVAETIAGRITYMLLFGGLGILPPIRDGRFVALAVTSAQRSSLLPEIPTVAEAGVAGFDFTEWYGMWAPVGTPTEIVDKIAKDVARALADPDVRASLAKMSGLEPTNMSRIEFERFVRSEAESVAYIVKASGIKPQ